MPRTYRGTGRFFSDATAAQIREWRSQHATWMDIARRLGCNVSTAWEVINQRENHVARVHARNVRRWASMIERDPVYARFLVSACRDMRVGLVAASDGRTIRKMLGIAHRDVEEVLLALCDRAGV